MIVLDTHIWIWWVHGDERLSRRQAEVIAAQENEEIGVSAISCWEVAKLAERGRLVLSLSIDDWLSQALQYPGLMVLPLLLPTCRASFIKTQPIRSLSRQPWHTAAHS